MCELFIVLMKQPILYRKMLPICSYNTVCLLFFLFLEDNQWKISDAHPKKLCNALYVCTDYVWTLCWAKIFFSYCQRFQKNSYRRYCSHIYDICHTTKLFSPIQIANFFRRNWQGFCRLIKLIAASSIAFRVQ